MSLSSVDQAPDLVTTPVDPALKTTSILEQARAASASIAAPRPASKLRPWLKESTHLLRRGHLYAGLLLLPWVFLYGITGFLFNHPTWFTDQKILTFGKPETEGTALAQLPKAGEIAGQVVAALNARGDGGYRLVAPSDARYERGGLGASLTIGGKPYSVAVNADGDGGTIREGGNRGGGGPGGGPGMMATPKASRGEGQGGPQEKGEGRPGREAGKRGGRGGEMRGGEGRGGEMRGGEGRGGEMRGGEGRGGEMRGGREEAPGSPFDVREGLVLASAPLVKLEQGLPIVLAKLGLSEVKMGEVRAAPLTFLMEGAGKRWLVTYTMATGAVAGRLADAATAGELSARRFLTGLHTTHGYPATFGPRWIWAVIVDIMSSIMVFWGLSGLVMWWQIKRTRRLGAVLLMLSVVAAVYVGMGMHDSMAASVGH